MVAQDQTPCSLRDWYIRPIRWLRSYCEDRRARLSTFGSTEIVVPGRTALTRGLCHPYLSRRRGLEEREAGIGRTAHTAAP
jgi:hypothetical protein